MKIIVRILSVLVTIVVPFILIMTAVRVLFNPFFLDYEYRMALFPADPYGFSTEDRLKWGKISMNYMFSDQPDDYLGTLKFADGTSIYNERELSHMLDVRHLVKAALKVWYVLLIVTFLTGLAAWKTNHIREYWKALALGGWVTLGLILLILISTLINFDSLFAAFHGLFFKGDTWLFYSNDTLIRLFPLKLWSDGFIFMGIFTLVGALLCIFVVGRLGNRE